MTARSSEHHRRIEELYAAALALPAVERMAYVDRVGVDEEMRAEVRELLAYAADPRAFLDPAGTADTGNRAPPMPDRIGAYRIVRLLGEGGMGAVYLAEQDEPVQRQVALKVVRPGMATAEVLARFEVERRALARMNHDFVARVYDTGLTDQGEPWLVMEYVDGEPIDRYCDGQCLDVAARLELFVAVCAGVQHAHQRGILHRDLKPQNVLVAVQGDRVVPKVIDFGLARAVDPTTTGLGAHTVVGRSMGTPGFMSPEQERGELVDTRTDIYSLGVLLHELLVGDLPSSDADRRPSTSLRARGTADTARARGTSLGGLQRQLRSGLDWVVAKSADPDPERRYASVSELAADVRRYLAHEPVLAGPPSAAYRLRKFARRHRYALSAALVVVLVAATGLTAWLGEARAAVRARDEAQAVNDFLIEDLLARARPEESLGRKVTVEEVFREAATKVGERFAAQPVQEAAVRAVIRDTFTSLGLVDAAEEQAQRCLELCEQHLGPRHPDTLTAAARLGSLWLSREEFERGEAMLVSAIDGLSAVCGSDDPRTLNARLALAAYWTFHAKAERGEAELRELVVVSQRVFGPADARTLRARSRLAQALTQRQAFQEAVAEEREVIVLRRETLGELHPDTLTSMNNVASNLVKVDQLDEALALFEELVPKSAQVRGDSQDHAIVLNNLGNCLQTMGRRALHDGDAARAEQLLARAEEILSENLWLVRAVYGPRSSRTASSLNNLALVLGDRGQSDQSIELYREALAIEREVLGDDARTTLVTWFNLAVAQQGAEDLEASLATFEELLEHGTDGLAVQPVTRGIVNDSYGTLLYQLGRYDEAETTLLSAYRDLAEHLGEPHIQTVWAMQHLVILYQGTGRAAEAAEWQARVDEVQGDR